MYAMGYETPEDLIDQRQAIGRGELTEKYGFNCCFPSVHDPSQAPPGRHTGLISMMAPFNLQEGAEKWYDRELREAQEQQCIAMLRKYAPNLTEDKILWTYMSTPLDISNKPQRCIKFEFKTL